MTATDAFVLSSVQPQAQLDLLQKGLITPVCKWSTLGESVGKCSLIACESVGAEGKTV